MELMKLGDIEIIPIVENRFRLDAGAMFGIIPKVIWSRMVAADNDNRIPLDINPLIIKTGAEIILVDTGFGDVLNEKLQKIFGLAQETRLDSELQKNGLKPEDISAVVFTHLHADHALGGLKKNGDGDIKLRFPNAKYFVQKREWTDAVNPNERTAATYLVDFLKLYEKSGRLELIEGDVEIFPHVTVKLLGGHTPGMQGVIVEGGGKHLIYPGDIMPLRYNIKIAYVPAVDLDPTTTMQRKRWLHEKMLKEDWLLAFDHDIDYKIAKFVTDEKGKVVPVKYEGE